jgi:superfamily II DNA or RNA helicase
LIELSFDRGSLVLRGASQAVANSLNLTFDERVLAPRAPAAQYAQVVRALHAQGYEYRDDARSYEEMEWTLRAQEPRAYQSEALAAWRKQRGRGVVVLPTGAGKTLLAELAIAEKNRSTLVVTPTLELVRQWKATLEKHFRIEVGVIGGGEHKPLPLTVTTYDSAYLHADRLGNRFGMLVFDECHHLPSTSYRLAALACIAPFRLGITATPERQDGDLSSYDELIGPICYRQEIQDLAGVHLAPYDTEVVTLDLDQAERESYQALRGTYTAFLRKHAIDMSSPRGFQMFIERSGRGQEGREAMLAYRAQRQLSFLPKAKLGFVEDILQKHCMDRTLLFTNDNRAAYTLAEQFLLPVITHQTKIAERIDILTRFRTHEYAAIVTSKVLNEGVDVPEANVAVIVSGSGSVREHVQRLGRVLRRQEGKVAVLYELVTGKTSEEGTSQRRREHSAYR